MTSIYDADAFPGLQPDESRDVEQEGHTFRVTATRHTAIHTGRKRFKVECITCNVVEHLGTTSPSAQFAFHLRAAKRALTPP